MSIRQVQAVAPASVGHPILGHLDGLHRFALRLTRDPDQARDLTQETVLRAWERRDTIVRDLRAWLFQTLYHTFVSDFRRLSRANCDGQFDVEASRPQDCYDAVPDVIAMQDVRRATEALPEELRAVAWLSDAEGLRLREIAQVLGWPVGTVASRLWRARQELRKLLAAYGPHGGNRYDL